MVSAPFREYVVFSLCDPNVSVRRIEASFRKRGNSLSGNPCLASLGPGCSANGRFGPDGQLHWYCKAGIAGVYTPRAGFLSLSSGPRCSASWLVWTRRLGLLVLTFVPRAVLLLVSQAPDARHHGRLGPQDSVEVHRCSSWTRFFSMPVVVLRVSWSRQCFTQWRFRSCSSSRSSLLFSRCVPFHCRQARVAKRLHCLDHCWRCSSWTSCSRPSLYNARCRLCPGSAQRCPWRHYRCSSWTRSWSLRQVPWPRQCAMHVLFKVVDFLIVAL